MSNKKVSYKNLLKQAISEYDTSKTVQVKGPMLDPILSWDGDGEIPVYKDAASILERYYFNENSEEPLMVSNFDESNDSIEEAEYLEADADKIKVGKREYNQDGQEPKTPSEKHGEGPGTQQAGTSNASNIKGDLKNQEEDIAKEDVAYEDTDDTLFAEDTLSDDIELFFSEQDEEGEEDPQAGLDVDDKMAQKQGEESAEKEEKKDEDDDDDDEDEAESDEVEEGVNFTEDAENAVIEKLIDEMEELDEAPMTYSGEGPKEGGKSQINYSKEGPAPGMEGPDEKPATGSEDDTKGSGTDQAGTGDSAAQIPPRKDQHDAMVKPKSYKDGEPGNRGVREDADLFDQDLDMEIIESLGLEEDEEDIQEKEWSGREVPKKKKYQDESSAVPGGPSPRKSGPEGEDWDEGRYYEESAMSESFELFKEAIKDDEDDDDDKIIA